MLRLDRRMPFCKIATSPLGETWQLIPYQMTVQRLDTCCSQFAQQNQQLGLRLPAHNLRTRRHACVCGHTDSHGQGPRGGVPDVYTQKYTDQENSVLTTEATVCIYMHKHCATAQKIGRLDVSGPMISKKVVPDKKRVLTSAAESGIIMYN